MFLYMVPLVLIAVVLLCFVDEKPLATSSERDILPETLEIDGLTLVSLHRSEDGENSLAPVPDGASA